MDNDYFDNEAGAPPPPRPTAKRDPAGDAFDHQPPATTGFEDEDQARADAPALGAPKLDMLPDLERFMVLVRNDAHAERFFDAKKSRWGYRPVRHAADADRLRLHLGDGPHLGAYLIKPGTNVTRLAAFDIDDHDGALGWDAMRDAASRLRDAADKRGLAAWAVRSGGGKGIHLMFRWDAEQPAAGVRDLLKAVLADAGYTEEKGGIAKREVEIFPKQAKVGAGPRDFGNLIALPFGRESVPLDADFQPIAIPPLWISSAPVPPIADGAQGKSREAGAQTAEKRPGMRWDALTRAALANVKAWAPELLPGGKWASNGDYRIPSKALGRDLQEELCIGPKGIYDQGEERGKRGDTITPVMALRKFAGAKTDEEAADMLIARVGLGPGDPRTDVANGYRFAEQHRDDALYCYPWKSWLHWDGRRYAVDAGGESMRRAKETAASIYEEAARAAVGNPKEGEALFRHAVASQGRTKLEAMLAMAQSEMPVKVEDLDADDMLLNLENGTLDLRTLTLRDHRREDRITKLAPVALDPGAACPTWTAFLERIYGGDRELIAFIRRAAGYALTASTKEQCLFLLHGVGANGKSTLLETLLAMMGDYGRPTEFRTLLNRENSEAVRNDVAALVGIRLVTAVEVGRGKRLDESMVKQITGGDTITARKLYQEFFDFRPKFKLMLAANNRPEIRGVDEGIWRRVLLIPHDIVIPPEERDRDLPAKLLAELPGILNWAIEGLREWRNVGLKPPAAVVAATAGYRAEMDLLRDFIETRCALGPKLHVTTGALYEAYTAWASDNGEDTVEKRTFGKMLKERGFGDTVMKVFGRATRVKLGLALLDDRHEERQAAFREPM